MRIACSHEPLSSAILDDFKLLHVRERLPGYGLLFETRDHLLQTLHLSLREYLTSAERSGAHSVALVPAHCELARLCLRTLREKRSGPTLDYAVKYGHVHLTAAAQALDIGRPFGATRSSEHTAIPQRPSQISLSAQLTQLSKADAPPAEAP